MEDTEEKMKKKDRKQMFATHKFNIGSYGKQHGEFEHERWTRRRFNGTLLQMLGGQPPQFNN